MFHFTFRVFLLRDSQSNPKTFVLSLCHMQKIKHFQILPVSTICFLYCVPNPTFERNTVFFPCSLYLHVCIDGWRRWGVLHSWWWPNTLHRLDPTGRVLPAKLWCAALQTQTPLCPDRLVNEGPLSTWLRGLSGQTLPVFLCLEEQRYPD